MPPTYGIHWFRRDLRVAGNPALHRSWKEHGGRVVGFFCFDSVFLSRPDFSPARFGFFLESLVALKKELKDIGSDLLVLDVGPSQAFEKLFSMLKSKGFGLPTTISFNRDYEPFARERDKRMVEFFQSVVGLQVLTERDHLLLEPLDIVRQGEKSFYQVYTPFSRAWFEKFKTTEIQERVKIQKKGIKYLSLYERGEAPKDLFKLTWKNLFKDQIPLDDKLEEYRVENRSRHSISLPGAGALNALARLKTFKKKSLNEYGKLRDFPDRDGTSQISVYLKNGSITVAQIISVLGLEDCTGRADDSRTKYFKELVWREFYYHILYHRPDVESGPFLEKYSNLKWENNEKLFELWKEGQTGFPIIDAGMRQLNTTGWMHNRVRMIVASFLTKDLLIDWRWGEKYFMEKLLDGDLAPNNGGWQWAASTGCDPQPYFRIFNPLLQSQKFDPEGDYIKNFLPELGKLSAKEIHSPHESGKPIEYPEPCVVHAEQKEKILSLYKSV